jgi:uncharacterized protein (UPF0332 family)
LKPICATDHAKFRAAISRAYYAAFATARNYLRDREGYSISATGEAHKYVSKQFQQSSDPARILVGEKLHRLRLYRNQADYVDTFPGLSTITIQSIQICEEIISKINNF